MHWCNTQEFKGWDPYDGLNSRLFQKIQFLDNSKFARLAWIQFFKHSPLNFRRIAAVPKEYNPKGIGLFLIGFCNLYKTTRKEEFLERIRFFTELLLNMRSKGWSGSCWGYNFDWQSQAFFQPRYTPTIVASSFIANALLDAWEIIRDNSILIAVRSTADFISKDLNRTYDSSGNFAFSYSPLDQTAIYNASLLGSCVLARLFHITGETWMKEMAASPVRYCIEVQNTDGSWFYSPLPHHKWIDNFHTGFNLECLARYMYYTGDHQFTRNLEKGFSFWLNNFFTEDGIPRYYHNRLFPIDLHSTAELILASSRTGKFHKNLPLINKVLGWTLKHMQSKEGYFYYQKSKFFINRIPYIRWTQAWMFAALSEYLVNIEKEKD